MYELQENIAWLILLKKKSKYKANKHIPKEKQIQNQ